MGVGNDLGENTKQKKTDTKAFEAEIIKWDRIRWVSSCIAKQIIHKVVKQSTGQDKILGKNIALERV